MTTLTRILLCLSCWCWSSQAFNRPKPKNLHRSAPEIRHNSARNLEHQPDFLDTALSLRGGGDEDETSVVESSLQVILGKVLGFLEKQAPPIAGYLNALLGSIESFTGLTLIPKKKTETTTSKKKKKSKKSKQASVSAQNDVEDEKEATSLKSKATTAKKKKKKSSSASSGRAKSLATNHAMKELKSSSPNYRIQRELKSFLSDPPPNLKVKVGKNLRVWIVTMKGAENTIYEGETFQLRIAFPAQYPTVPPSVYFLPPNIPVHEHVYTNGDICLSLLGKDWRPTMTAQSIAVSILSILSSAQSKSLPMDNARHAQNKPGEYQKDWVYHDDNC